MTYSRKKNTDLPMTSPIAAIKATMTIIIITIIIIIIIIITIYVNRNRSLLKRRLPLKVLTFA